MSRWRLVLCVLLPFAAGYYLSYLFRCINALIAGDLAAELGLGAADLGLLTSVYFLVFAAVMLPCGVLLDRYGPRLVDSTLLVVAAAGSLLFAVADSVASLLVGRALIGLGVAVGLMAGLKAIVLWFPPERVALANGCYIMLGALGALSATGPAETVVQALGWRPVRRSRRGLGGRGTADSSSSCRSGSRRHRPPLPHRRSASSRSTWTRASCASHPWPRWASARPSRCRASGRRRGSPTLRGSTVLPSSSI